MSDIEGATPFGGLVGTPARSLNNGYKRIIVCCDGTWQDGLDATRKSKYTNILRLARAVNQVDDRFQPPIHQVVFYQSGIGTENLYDKFVDGVTGATLASKVEDAYGFIAHNYHPGDEIFLFGFSRGAYTARMVAMFIGAIGILDRTQMDHFATIFLAYQKRGKAEDPEKVRQLNQQLAPWTDSNAPGKLRFQGSSTDFSVKVIGVFDTVGSVGMPEELTFRSEEIRNVFGFPDRILGSHVERAYHALALNETRADFNCAKFEQTEIGRRKGQVLKQCWFTGSHCDIGGGFEQHDLSDITLNWMIANIEDAISFNYDYVTSLPRPDALWGTQPYHNPLTGIYSVATVKQRVLPTATNNVTHEVIHPSVLEQEHTTQEVQDIIDHHPTLVHQLLPLEARMKEAWAMKLKARSESTASEPIHEMTSDPGLHHHASSLFHKAEDVIVKFRHYKGSKDAVVESHSEHAHNQLEKVITESRAGALIVQELVK